MKRFLKENRWDLFFLGGRGRAIVQPVRGALYEMNPSFSEAPRLANHSTPFLTPPKRVFFSRKTKKGNPVRTNPSPWYAKIIMLKSNKWPISSNSISIVSV